jgi:dihydrofolate synthase / folylpolyglutamate synthase
MKLESIKTHKITTTDKDILAVIDRYVTDLPERSVLAVTSKIVSICEGSVVPVESISKTDIIRRESDAYLPPEKSKYGIVLAMKNGLMAPSAGIDESNGNGFYILWPRDAYSSANLIRRHLEEKFGVQEVGVVITDSTVSMMRWGTIGVSIAYSGIRPLHNYIGSEDLFGHALRVTKASIVNGLAASAVMVMGEGSEQTPLSILSELPFVHFTKQDTSLEEIASLQINPEDDLYAPLITAVEWEH